MKNAFLRSFWRFTIGNALRLVAKIELVGQENIPTDGPNVVIVNHFSYLDPLILMARLPMNVRFMAAVEMTKIRFMSHLLRVFEGIPVWRGQVDREALKVAATHLENGGNIGVFPEGGIIPELQERVARGEKIVDVPNTKSRLPAILAAPRPGTAYVAVNTDAKLLPIALIGTEQLEGNLKRFPFRRTRVQIKIGKPFGPFAVDPALRGRAKRRELDAFGTVMMQHIAQLLPEQQRGDFTKNCTKTPQTHTQSKIGLPS